MGRRRRHSKARLDPKQAQICIVGTGLAGLSTALALQKQQCWQNVHIFDRDASLEARKEGYGMTITYNPRGVLGQNGLDILEELALADCPSRSHYMLKAPAGQVLGYFGNAFATNRGVGQRGNLRVPRQQVRKILHDRLFQRKEDKVNPSDCGDKCDFGVHMHWNHTLCAVTLAEQNIGRDSIRNVCQNKFVDTSPYGDGDDDIDDDPRINLHFSNGAIFRADLIVAADGWNSAVLRFCLPPSPKPSPRCRSLDVYIIVGLARNVQHPLVNECGFYTLGPRQRLFVMPFSARNAMGDIEENEINSQGTISSTTMWQLSFVAPGPRIGHNPNDPHDSISYVRANAADYWQQAQTIVGDWHAPIPTLLQNTTIDSVWGTLLQDVDPVLTATQLKQSPFQSRVVPVGDALHAMSPFKGQGANQALQDGVILARRLSTGQCSRQAVVKTTIQEIVQRTAPVVKASREAAAYWHEAARWQDTVSHSFAGLSDKTNLTETLHEAGISAAATQGRLDTAIRNHIEQSTGVQLAPVQSSFSVAEDNIFYNVKMDLNPRQVLNTARRGNLEQLRIWAWEIHPRLLQTTADKESGNTCLHAVVQGALEVSHEKKSLKQHFQCLQWLVTQAGCSVHRRNRLNQRPFELVPLGHLCDNESHKIVLKMLQKLEDWENFMNEKY
jgi:2-polyprenyl-6-methoxyphenol hydroxylase-like FAD-dependent oxidoreductase